MKIFSAHFEKLFSQIDHLEKLFFYKSIRRPLAKKYSVSISTLWGSPSQSFLSIEHLSFKTSFYKILYIEGFWDVIFDSRPFEYIVSQHTFPPFLLHGFFFWRKNLQRSYGHRKTSAAENFSQHFLPNINNSFFGEETLLILIFVSVLGRVRKWEKGQHFK